MAILINEQSKVLVQGITGREGLFHTQQMKAYGTQIVAGVTPGKGGTEVEGIPVYDTVAEAVEKTGADVSCVFVPAPFAADAAVEAARAGVELVVLITEGVPVQDMAKVCRSLNGTRLIGPNCPGLVSPGKAKVGIIPNSIVKPGRVGLVSRSGTLTYELLDDLSRRGYGQSTCVGIGGDPILGMRFKDVLPLFEEDPETELVLMVGEIGGEDEEEACEVIRKMKTPVLAFVSGRTAPPGKRMGHAGAIVSGGKGTAESKIAAFESVGVPVADSTKELVDMAVEKLGKPAEKTREA